MAILKYRNPNYTEGGNEEKWIEIYGSNTVYSDSGVSSFTTEVVTELPSTGTNGVLYLMLSDNSGTSNIYDEYIWVTSTNTFEKLGVFVDVDNINSTISTLQNTVSSLQSIVTGMQGTIDSLQTSINTNTTNISSLTTRVSEVETKASNLAGEYETLHNTVSTNTNNITTINSTITSIQSDIDGITPPDGYELVMITKN